MDKDKNKVNSTTRNKTEEILYLGRMFNELYDAAKINHVYMFSKVEDEAVRDNVNKIINKYRL